MCRLLFLPTLTLLCLLGFGATPISPLITLHASTASISMVQEDTEATVLDPSTIYLKHSYICNAVSIDEAKHLWLTAYHCVINSGQPSKGLFIRGKLLRVVKFNALSDLAIVTADVSAPAVRVREHPLDVGEMVFMSGAPLGFSEPFDAMGMVSNVALSASHFKKPYAIFAMAVCKGHSGSPIVDSIGALVSILQYGFGETCSSFAGGATQAQLLKFLEIDVLP